MSKRNCCILVATHKTYEFPNDDGFFPIHVGAINSSIQIDGIQRDDQGESISELNPYFCELTGLYWAWKNMSADVFGLVHYRRYFRGDLLKVKDIAVASSAELINLLNDYDILISKKRWYIVDTVREHYKNAHYEEDLSVVRECLSELYPNYVAAFDQLMSQRGLSLYNMFVMRSDLFDQYMFWLFGILFRTKDRIDVSEYDPYQQRVFGFLAERLFNVWIIHHSDSIRIKQLPVVNIEGENFFLKALGLLRRKFSKAR